MFGFLKKALSITLLPYNIQTTVDDVENQFRQIRVQADLVRREYRQMEAEVASMTDMLYAFGGFVWRKDANERYLFANRAMRNGLLVPHMHAIDPGRDLSDRVLKKTDAEILSGSAPYDSVCSTFLETNAALAMAKKHNSLRFYAHIPMLIRSPVFRQMPHGDHLQC